MNETEIKIFNAKSKGLTYLGAKKLIWNQHQESNAYSTKALLKLLFVIFFLNIEQGHISFILEDINSKICNEDVIYVEMYYIWQDIDLIYYLN